MSRILSKLRQNVYFYLNNKLNTSSRVCFSDSSKDGSNDDKSKNIIKVDDDDDVKSPQKKVYYEDQIDAGELSKLTPWEDGYDPANSKDPLNQTLMGYKYPNMFLREHRTGVKRAVQIFKSDMQQISMGRMSRPENEIFPNHADIVIFGGGIMGSSIAYWLKERGSRSFSVLVIDKDLMYTRCSTTLSVGGIRQQFSLPENIQMSMYSAEFLRNAKKHLSILDVEPPDVSFYPQGYLITATEAGAEQLLENHKTQTELGAYVDILTREQMKSKFPYLNTEGIALGTYGVQNEGWFDPYSLLIGFKTKAECLGARYLEADILDFNLNTHIRKGVYDDTGNEMQQCNHVVVRLSDGTIRQIEFAFAIVAAGAYSGQISRMLRMGESNCGIRTVPCPVEPRKRYVYVFNCIDGPGIDFPFYIDPTFTYCRREGLGGNFICGRSPNENEEPDISNLDVDYTFFDNNVWPVLANRVKAFEAIKLKGAWAGYYDYNTFDQNGIIGNHPYYPNFIWATGFSGHGIQMAPAVGRAVSEIIIDGGYKTINLTRFGWERLFENRPLRETDII